MRISMSPHRPRRIKVLRNTREAYGSIAKLFHWVVAVWVLGLLAYGLLMGVLAGYFDKAAVYGLHKAAGFLLLWVLVGRLLWKAFNPPVSEPPEVPRWQRLLAGATHGGLYVLMFAMPLTGWIFATAQGRVINVFGLFSVGAPFVGSDAWAKQAHELHELLWWGLAGLAAVHIAAALWHRFVKHDSVLARMWPRCCRYTSRD